jgi:hypothetical protein
MGDHSSKEAYDHHPFCAYFWQWQTNDDPFVPNQKPTWKDYSKEDNKNIEIAYKNGD